jgi:hypothetical protein
MGKQALIGTPLEVAAVQHKSSIPHWHSATRLTFRFALAYLALYSLMGQFSGGLLLFPGFSFPGLGPLWPFREFTFWLAGSLFDIHSGLVYNGNSGDTYFFWVQEFWVLLVAIVTTAAWSVLDRHRENYVTLHKWFRLFVRLAVAAQMFDYGMAKVIPTQMPSPSLITLVEPVGRISLAGLLWTNIGASPAYEIFTGLAEVFGGVLLLVPATTLFGALVCLADMIMVLLLNLTYDVGLTLIAFNLILMIAFLLAPDIRRLIDFLLLDRAPPPSRQLLLFKTARANRNSIIAQIAFGIWLIGMYTNITVGYWREEGEPGGPKSALYGIWDIEQLSIDGQAGPAALNDYDRRWRRVIFDTSNKMAFQRTDDSFAHYGVQIDESAKTLSLTKGRALHWHSNFAYQRPVPDELTLDGEMDGYKIVLHLKREEFDTFRLLNSTFRWVRPADPPQP